MKYLVLFFIFTNTMYSNVIFDFNSKSAIDDWIIVDDVVMGGKSSGNFSMDSDGNGLFQGDVSLENNGGFSSVRYRFNKKDVSDHSKIVLKIRGDGKRYQFRVKTNSSDYHSYIYYFSTSGEWQIVEVPLNKMYPSFRGRKLNMENFASDYIEEVAILIANKKDEDFKLLIDNITLK